MFQATSHAREAAMEEGTLFDSKPKAPGSFNVAELEAPARFLNLDPDLWVFRRFGKLHLLNILHLQQHLAKLEYQLEREKSNQVPRNLEKLMRKIKRAVAEYGMLVPPRHVASSLSAA